MATVVMAPRPFFPGAPPLGRGNVRSPSSLMAAGPVSRPRTQTVGVSVNVNSPSLTKHVSPPGPVSSQPPIASAGMESVQRAKEVLAGTVPVTGEIRVACLGDSLTQCGYPDGLHQLLNASSDRTWRVMDFGKGGAGVGKRTFLAYAGSPEFQQALQCNPDVFIIQLGTNDAKKGIWEPQGGAQGFIAEYRMLLERVLRSRSPPPRVILAAPPPAYRESMGVLRSVVNAELPSMIKGLAESLGIAFADAFGELGGASLSRPSAVGEDGIHLGPEGNTLLAYFFHGAVLRVMGEDASPASAASDTGPTAPQGSVGGASAPSVGASAVAMMGTAALAGLRARSFTEPAEEILRGQLAARDFTMGSSVICAPGGSVSYRAPDVDIAAPSVLPRPCAAHAGSFGGPVGVSRPLIAQSRLQAPPSPSHMAAAPVSAWPRSTVGPYYRPGVAKSRLAIPVAVPLPASLLARPALVGFTPTVQCAPVLPMSPQARPTLIKA